MIFEKEEIITTVRKKCHKLNLLRSKWQGAYNLNPKGKRTSKKQLDTINKLRDDIDNTIIKHDLDKRVFNY